MPRCSRPLGLGAKRPVGGTGSVFCVKTACSCMCILSAAGRFKIADAFALAISAEILFLNLQLRNDCGRFGVTFSREGTFRSGGGEFPEQIPAKWGPGAQHWGGTGGSGLRKALRRLPSQQAHLLALVLGADQRTGGGQAAHTVAVGVGQL